MVKGKISEDFYMGRIPENKVSSEELTRAKTDLGLAIEKARGLREEICSYSCLTSQARDSLLREVEKVEDKAYRAQGLLSR
jgi:maleate cis-trans isomerase